MGGLVNCQVVKKVGFGWGYLSVCPSALPGCYYIIFSSFSSSNPGFAVVFLFLSAKLNESRGSQ